MNKHRNQLAKEKTECMRNNTELNHKRFDGAVFS